jgi:hypothetical protein
MSVDDLKTEIIILAPDNPLLRPLAYDRGAYHRGLQQILNGGLLSS